jgi:hypothetical protein
MKKLNKLLSCAVLASASLAIGGVAIAAASYRNSRSIQVGKPLGHGIFARWFHVLHREMPRTFRSLALRDSE